jgi:hypothetical protein
MGKKAQTSFRGQGAHALVAMRSAVQEGQAAVAAARAALEALYAELQTVKRERELFKQQYLGVLGLLCELTAPGLNNRSIGDDGARAPFRGAGGAGAGGAWRRNGPRAFSVEAL